jgi:hypothetical protein
MRTPSVLLAGAALLATGAGFAADQRPAAQAPQKPSATAMAVYKSPTCGCCSAWIEHVRARGLQVDANNVSDSQLNVIAIQSGVPGDLVTCHTAKVGGYIVEGHVPVEDILRMLKEKPAIAGIAVAGMPLGSPGMEQGGVKQPFSTMAFTKDGKTTVFARH